MSATQVTIGFRQRLDPRLALPPLHDLRHSYATWLVYDGVPINDAQRLLGHERPSTTLDLYTHYQQTSDPRVDGLFEAFSLPDDSDEKPDDDDGEAKDAV